MFRGRTLALLALTAAILTPARAQADVLLIPFFGVNFGGDAGKDLSDAFDSNQFNWGVSFAAMGAGVFGVEGDIGYSPDFFGKTDAGGSHVLTVMGNLVLGIPFGGQRGFGVRPYGLVGMGLMRSSVKFGGAVGEVDENKFAWDFGGGVIIFFGTNFGIRGDVRYFRTFEALDILGIDIAESPGKLDYTRGTFGFVFRF
jgi:opacity protein-like surface antigen